MITIDVQHPEAARVRVRRPGPRALLALIRSEARMVVRDTAGLIVPFGLPVLILLTSALAAGAEEIAHGLTALELYVLPLVFTMVIGMIGVINMPSMLATYRRTGVLKRLATTPISPGMVLLAQTIVSALQAMVGILISLAVAVLAFGARLPNDPLAVLGVGLLVILAMYALGMVVASLAPTPNSAVAIGIVLFFALGALGGMFGGRQALPGPLAEIGAWLPFGAGVDALAAAWAGVAVEPAQLLVLAAAVVFGGIVSAAFFRWE